ncbi:MAG TPA: hypothetical protein QF873_01440 [Patescibacteria group bacterium]|nr:hypothetical protein [Patescibacteria group bacterium]
MRVRKIRKMAMDAGADLPGTPAHAVWTVVEASLITEPELLERYWPKEHDDELGWMGSLVVAPFLALIENQSSTWRWPLVRRWYATRRMWRRFVRRPALDLWERITVG